MIFLSWLSRRLSRPKIPDNIPSALLAARIEQEEALMTSRSLKPYPEFIAAMGARESGNNYTIKNSFGYLGRFQFGTARLCDFGLCKRIPGTTGFANRSFEWVPPYSEKIFLESKTLQDKIFEVHVAAYRDWILRKYAAYIDRDIHGVKVTLSGIIACFHLLGEGGFKDFIAGKDSKDAYGTKGQDYIELFAGYVIPDNLHFITQIEIKNYVEIFARVSGRT